MCEGPGVGLSCHGTWECGAQPLCSLSASAWGSSRGAPPDQDTPCPPGKHRPARVGPGLSSLPMDSAQARGLAQGRPAPPTRVTTGDVGADPPGSGSLRSELEEGPWGRCPGTLAGSSFLQARVPAQVRDREREWPFCGLWGGAEHSRQEPGAPHTSTCSGLWEGSPARRPAPALEPQRLACGWPLGGSWRCWKAPEHSPN